MILIPVRESGASLRLIEGSLMVIAVVTAFCLPTLGSRYLSRVEQAFGKLARRQGLAVAVVGLTAFTLRLAMLPLCPIPGPFVPDDFSFLLAGNTFALGRLTNPTPAMWTHFESIHISMQPTYMSMYFPAQGLILAAAKVLTGHAWFGLLCITALMCAAICWMLQAWLPPSWALLGGMLAVLRLGLFSYWINTYAGAGSIAALAGALVLGAFPRLIRTARLRYSLLLGVGAAVLALNRPYEGILLCLPVTAILLRWLFFGRNRPPAAARFRIAAAPLALIVAAGMWMGYYDKRVFGNPLTPPYALNRAAYSVAPYWVWQSARPEPVYRHKVMRDFYIGFELPYLKIMHRLPFLLAPLVFKPVVAIWFYAGIALAAPLLMLRRALLDRRIRTLVLCGLVWGVGIFIEMFLVPHYLAPFTAAIYAIGLQCMRHLRVWKAGGQPAGVQFVRMTVTICVVLAVLRCFADPLHITYAQWPGIGWNWQWSGPGQYGAARARVEAQLEKLPGRQLAIVRYTPGHYLVDEWVYNDPDIDSSKVIWAREMDAADNEELIHYYKDRKVWLLQPDERPAVVTPYASSEQK